MSDLIDEFVTELQETGSTGSRNPDLTPPMYKRTPGIWSWEYDSKKQGYAILVESEKEIHPTPGDMQLMSYAPDMHKLLWQAVIFLNSPEATVCRQTILQTLACINVEPPEGVEQLIINSVNNLRNTKA